MARGYEEDDPEEDRMRNESSQEEEEQGSPTDAKARKKAALMPAIASLCSALGGFEDFLDHHGAIQSGYSVGHQVVGELANAHRIDGRGTATDLIGRDVGCLKDLKRFWRLDENDDDRTVARIFHEVGLLKNDLIPIMKVKINEDAKGARIALACGMSPLLSTCHRD